MFALGIIVLQGFLRVKGFKRSKMITDNFFSRGEGVKQILNNNGVIRRYRENLEKATQLPLISSGCLVKSMVLRLFLRRKGILTDLRIGHRFDETQGFQAHAWLEYQGSVINDGDSVNVDYKQFDYIN